MKSANLNGYFTNHSLRRTSATCLFQAGVDKKKIVREITGHVSDALDKYEITSKKQKEHVSKILNNAKEPQIEQEKEESEIKIPPVPSFELSVTENSKQGMSNVITNCNCKCQNFQLGDGKQLTDMINDLVSKCRSGKAKIKLEIEFSD